MLLSVTRPQPSQLRPSPVRRLFAHLAAADLLVIFVVMTIDIVMPPGISLFNGWPGTSHVGHSCS